MDRPILLTGRSGQIGADLLPLVSNLGPVVAPDRARMDLLDPESVRNAVRAANPWLIVNAAAYTAVDQAESEEPIARAVNADAPALIAQEARRIGAGVIHYSTDYVFDGAKSSPYTESDPVAPLNAYGRTKQAGEEAICSSGVPHLILRTSWIYSTRGRNFVLTMLRLASERDELRIVADQTGSPTWSREVASATAKLIAKLRASGPLSALEAASGAYHITAAGETTWFAFAQSILDCCSLERHSPWIRSAMAGRGVKAKRLIAIASAEYPAAARRPAYSVLDNAKLLAAFGLSLPHWRAQLDSMFRAG